MTLVLCSKVTFGQTKQAISLGILDSFEAYTGAGAVTNSGVSWKGDAGTHIGIMSGFDGPSFTDNTYNADGVTAQCRFDLFRLYIHLNDLFVTYPGTHAAEFGGGETIAPGVYSIPGAGSLGGAITLDGGGDPNAYFVIKYNGAMTVGAGATVTLTGGTQSCNVFWIAEGAISVAASADLKGTLFAHIGAVGLGVGATLEGRMLSLEGAIVAGASSTVSPPPGTSTIPIFCESGCSPAAAVDVLGVISNFALYTSLGAVANTSTSGIDGNIGTDSGIVSGFASSVVIGNPYSDNAITDQAKTDLNYAYNALMALPNTVPSAAEPLAHSAVFGGGEKVKPGVYFINGAGSLGGTVTLDALNNPDAIFVFKFAGAFSVAAQSKIILANGARRCNVFWIGGAGVATGAISIGAASVLKGTFLSHGGACGSGAGVFLAGRQLSTGGAVNTYSGIVYNNPVCVTSKSLTDIDAVADTTVAISGIIGGITAALTLNDTLKGNLVVLGTGPGHVTMAILGVLPAGITVDTTTGIVTVAANTTAGNYEITYEICEVSNPINCDLVNSIIVVAAAPAAPAVALIKTSSVTGMGLGDVITYTFKVINTGNATLTNVVVTDPMVGLTITGSSIASLVAGDSSLAFTGTYMITQADLDAGSVTNSAFVTAKDSNNIDITDSSGTAIDNNLPTLTTITSASAVALVKTASVNGSGILGDTISYVFTVTNTGLVSLTNLTITDSIVAITGSPITSLAPGTTATATATYIITQTDIDSGKVTNSATIIAKDPNGKDVFDVSGTTINNDTPTVTLTPTLTVLPDFTLTLDIDALVFLAAGPSKDFVVNISEVKGAPSNGPLVIRIVKGNAFLITYNPTTIAANLNNAVVSVSNSDWEITENSFFITMTLKPGLLIGKNAFSSVGFTINRKLNTPSQTTQPITVTIVDGSGSDSQNYNNTYSTIITAQ